MPSSSTGCAMRCGCVCRAVAHVRYTGLRLPSRHFPNHYFLNRRRFPNRSRRPDTRKVGRSRRRSVRTGPSTSVSCRLSATRVAGRRAAPTTGIIARTRGNPRCATVAIAVTATTAAIAEIVAIAATAVAVTDHPAGERPPQASTSDRLARPIQNPSMTWSACCSGSSLAPSATKSGAKCSIVGWA